MQITVFVTAYTPRGMVASDRQWPLEDAHRGLQGMELISLFRRDDPSTFIYSPFRTGFIGPHYYTIKIQEAGRARFICNFGLDRRDSAKALPGLY